MISVVMSFKIDEIYKLMKELFSDGYSVISDEIFNIEVNTISDERGFNIFCWDSYCNIIWWKFPLCGRKKYTTKTGLIKFLKQTFLGFKYEKIIR